MFVDDIHHWARTHPEKTAVIHNDKFHSYKNLANYIDYARSFFAKRSLQRGGTVAIMIHNLLVSWIIVGALRAAGIHTICVQSFEQLAALKVSNLVAIIVAKSEHKSITVPPHVIVFPDADMFKARSRPLNLYSALGSDCGGHILYTSGTTGTYKKVFYAGDKSERRCSRIAERFNIKSDTVFHILNFPLFTGAGYFYPLITLKSGGCVVFDQSQSPFHSIYKYNVSIVFAIPTILQQWLKFAEQQQLEQGQFAILTGGGFLSLTLAEHIKTRITDTIFIAYGATETLSVMRSQFTSLDDLQWYEPASWREVKIFDEDGKECHEGTEGELAIRVTDADADSYLDDERTTRHCFRNGYFFPGDMAIKRSDGRIRILGRVADVLNLKGWKIAAAPLEQRIQAETKARAVCLFARLNDEGEDEIAVAMETDQALSKAQTDFIRQQLKPADNIRYVCLNRFPRTQTAMQKLNRKELRDMVFSQTKLGETLP